MEVSGEECLFEEREREVLEGRMLRNLVRKIVLEKRKEENEGEGMKREGRGFRVSGELKCPVYFGCC